MKTTIFAKKRTTDEGKKFVTYIGKLLKKSGEEISVSVKFKEECGQPKAENCPMNIIFPKETANLASREYTDENGDVHKAYTLWISEWKQGESYVDHSLDDFAE